MNPLDLEEFERQGYMMIDFLTAYYKNIENYHVLRKLEPGYLAKNLSSSPQFQPESIESILEDVQQNIIPGITYWMSPNYYAYFPSSGSTTGFVGEMLSNGFNVVGFNLLSSPTATELETIVMNWLEKMLNLPKCFIFSSNFERGGGGVLLCTTCEAILCTLVAAREEKLSQNWKKNILENLFCTILIKHIVHFKKQLKLLEFVHKKLESLKLKGPIFLICLMSIFFLSFF